MEENDNIPTEAVILGTQLAGRLAQVLQEKHTGIDRAVKSPDLLVELFGAGHGSTSYNNIQARAIRKAITKINARGGLVCSTPAKGYWWAASLQEGLPAASRKISRALHILEAARQLDKNLRRHFGGQMNMEAGHGQTK